MFPDLTDAQIRELLAQGLSQREIAKRTGLPRATLQGRLKRLGLQATPAAPAPQVPTAPPVTTAAPAVTFVAVPEMQELLSLVKDLHSRVEALEQMRVTPALPAPPVPPVTHTTPVQPVIPAPPVVPVVPAPPASERKDVQQWTVRLSKALIDHLKAVAYERRIAPSQLLEELVWHALHDR
jgi:hypothetical protein